MVSDFRDTPPARALMRASSSNREGPVATPAPSSMSTDPKHELEPVNSPLQQRSTSWEVKHPEAIIYNPEDHELSTVQLAVLERDSNKFEVYLPRWQNRVDIYVDRKGKSGFVASVRLDKLGRSKNWQRRLRHNYTSLYVKGQKPHC